MVLLTSPLAAPTLPQTTNHGKTSKRNGTEGDGEGAESSTGDAAERGSGFNHANLGGRRIRSHSNRLLRHALTFDVVVVVYFEHALAMPHWHLPFNISSQHATCL
jgi:hypothetical protein